MKQFFHTLIWVLMTQFGFSQTDSLISQFEIHNSDSTPQIGVLDIETIQTIGIANRELRLVVSGTGGATDFGAYRETYLIFDNSYELPWRYAVYELGSFGTIDSIKKESETSISFEAVLYSKVEEFECGYCTLKIMIDLSDVIKKETKLDKEEDSMDEGHIASFVKVEVSKKME